MRTTRILSLRMLQVGMLHVGLSRATYRIHLDASGEELETTKPDSIETEAQKAEKEK